MKVGDLVKVNTDLDDGVITPAVMRHGQLAVIIGDIDDSSWQQWKVVLMSGEKFWFDDDELKVQE